MRQKKKRKMTPQEVRKTISKHEGISVELKECTQGIHPSVYESVCSFLNRLGGIIIMGVSDKGEILGIDEKHIGGMQKNFVNQINNKEILNPITYIIPEVVEMEDGKKVIVLNVPESPQVHTYKKHFYDRNDEGDMDITDNQYLISAMFLRKSAYSSEKKVIPGLTIDDFSEETFEKTRRELKVYHPDHIWRSMTNEEILKHSGFWDRDPETGKEGFILAALLLWGKEEAILKHLPYYQTDAIYWSQPFKRFIAPTKEIGESFYDDRERLSCNLIETYETLMNFVRRNMRHTEVMDETGGRRIDLREIIFREIISNFCIHREYYYNYTGRILIYSDRFITENWTKQTQRGAVDLDTLRPNRKNPIISNVFGLMNYYEGVGKGMSRIKQYLPLYNRHATVEIENGDEFRFTINMPQYYQINDSESLSFMVHEAQAPYGAVPKPAKKTFSLNEKERMIVRLVKNKPNITQSAIAAALGYSRQTIHTLMKKLVEQGVIIHVGPDKGGHWEVI